MIERFWAWLGGGGQRAAQAQAAEDERLRRWARQMAEELARGPRVWIWACPGCGRTIQSSGYADRPEPVDAADALCGSCSPPHPA